MGKGKKNGKSRGCGLTCFEMGGFGCSGRLGRNHLQFRFEGERGEDVFVVNVVTYLILSYLVTPPPVFSPRVSQACHVSVNSTTGYGVSCT